MRQRDITLPAVKSTDPLMIRSTSGTNGFPKGALLDHRGLVNICAHTAERMGIRDCAVHVTTMPLFHTGACSGGSTVPATLVRRFEA